MTADLDDATVHYTVKELLANLQKEVVAGNARLEVSLSGKADKADVARLELGLGAQAKEIQHHHDRLLKVEAEVREEKISRETARSTNAWWHTRFAKFGGFLVGLALVITAAVTIAQLFN